MIDQTWLNGDWVDAGSAQISVGDRGFLLGDTCFETLYFNGRYIEGKSEHLSLLGRSMDVLQFPDCDFAALEAALKEAEDRLQQIGLSAASVRMTVSRGEGRGAFVSGAPNCVLQFFKLEHARPFEPLKVFTSAIRRNETSPLVKIKAGCYGDHLAALRAAAEVGGNEALMLNTQGKVAGLAMGNIFVRLGGEWVTPPVEDGVRNGFMRSTVIAFLKSKGASVQVRSIKVEELFEKKSVSAFGVNSLWGSRPILSIDGKKLEQSDIQMDL